MNYITHYTRITNSSRLTDRFLTTQIRQSPESKIKKGTIFTVVEITNPWLPSSQIGQTIINTLAKEYYKSSNSNNLVNFELAVKKVNETLAHITQNGEIDWIGNLNALLAVICDNQLFLAQTGKGEAFLFRGGKINHITEGLNQQSQTHPLKTFSNITSGSLESNDKIILTSPGLFDYFSLENLRQIITQSSHTEASMEIVRRLKKEKVKDSNALIIHVLSKEEATNQTVNQDLEVVYLDEQGVDAVNQNLKRLLGQIMSSFSQLRKILNRSYKSAEEFTKTKLVPKTKSGWKATQEISRKGFYYLKNKTKPVLEKSAKPISAKMGKLSKKFSFESNRAEITDKNLYNVRHYTKPRTQNLNNYLDKLKLAGKKTTKLLVQIYKWLTAKEHRSSLYILLITILVIALVLSIGRLRGKQDNQVQQTTAYQNLLDAETKFDQEVKLAILYNDKTKARRLLSEIIDTTKNIDQSSEFKTKADELYLKAQDELDKFSSITRIKEKNTVAEFPPVNNIAITKDGIFGIYRNNNKIFTNPRGEGFTTGQITLPTEAGNIKDLTSLGDDKTILVYSENRQVFKTTGSQESLEEIKPKDSDWQTADKISLFYSNIYLLNRTIGQVFKHSKGPDGYETASEFIDIAKTNVKNAVSMTIDGSIYVLGGDGGVVKLSKGEKQEFKLEGIPTPDDKITNPKEIYTDEDAESIYLLDANRLLELDKTGKFIHQYVVEGLDNVDDFCINYKSKKIWFLDSNKVYEVNY